MNLSEIIKSKLNAHVKAVLNSVTENKDDCKIYLVGGVVRDLLLGKEIFDVDITVEGDAVELCRLLEKKEVGKIKQIQKDLKTAKMVFADGVEIDFASTRKETYPQNGHMPVVTQTGCELSEDVKRRDFTVNSLAVSLNKEDYGEVKDYVNGIADLEKKQLRVLHDKSFIEDPTRIIRGLKFSVRFGFSLEQDTKALQEDYFASYLSADICHSRIKAEFEQTFSLNLSEAYEKFIEQKIYRLINPDFDKIIDAHLIKEFIDAYKPEKVWLVYLGAVLSGSKILDLWNLSKFEKKIITDLQKLLDKAVPVDNFGVYKFFCSVALESVIVFYLMTKNQHALAYLEGFRHVKIEVSGSDLVELGLKPSELFGELLDSVLAEKLSGELLTRDDELDFLKFQIKQLKK